MAIRSAKTLIDFTNIGLETEVLDMQGRPAGDNVEIELEEVIVFENEISGRDSSFAQTSKRRSTTSSKGQGGSTGAESSTAVSPGAGSIQSSSKLRNMMDRQKALKKQRNKYRLGNEYDDDISKGG